MPMYFALYKKIKLCYVMLQLSLEKTAMSQFSKVKVHCLELTFCLTHLT